MNKFYSLFPGTEWIFDDDDSEWQVAVHIGQRCGVPRSLNGELNFMIFSTDFLHAMFYTVIEKTH